MLCSDFIMFWNICSLKETLPNVRILQYFVPQKTFRHKSTSVAFCIPKNTFSKLCEFHMLFKHCEICYYPYSLLSVVEWRTSFFFTETWKQYFKVSYQKIECYSHQITERFFDLCDYHNDAANF